MPYRTSRKREGQEGLCRGPYAIILNRLYIIIRTIVFSKALPHAPKTLFSLTNTRKLVYLHLYIIQGDNLQTLQRLLKHEYKDYTGAPFPTTARCQLATSGTGYAIEENECRQSII